MDKFNIKDSHPNISRLEKLFLEEGVFTKFKKNEYLVQQNEKTNQIGFIKSGMFRLSHIDADANEWIVGYSFVNDFVCDYPSFIKQATSTVNIQATTECEVYLLSLNRLNQFWETDMDTQRLGRQIAEAMFAEIYQRLLGFYCDSPEQRYPVINETMSRFTRKTFFKRNSPVSRHYPRNPQQNTKKTTVYLKVLTLVKAFIFYIA